MTTFKLRKLRNRDIKEYRYVAKKVLKTDYLTLLSQDEKYVTLTCLLFKCKKNILFTHLSSQQPSVLWLKTMYFNKEKKTFKICLCVYHH